MTLAPPVPPHVMWHEVECGRYHADLGLWDELARDTADGVLDVGAGTGRVAIPLARAGHAVTALDIDAALLDVLGERAHEESLDVPTVVADAEAFSLAGQVGLVIVPMQTLQLLGDRAGFFAAVRRALVPGGRLAAAIATGLEGFDDAEHFPPPDYGEIEGWAFISQPIAIRVDPGAYTIVRVREMVAPDGLRTCTPDTITLAAVTPAELADEAAAHGLEAEELRHVPETDEHVGSEVVVFRG
jgi:SAM-dependent methyltransferase